MFCLVAEYESVLVGIDGDWLLALNLVRENLLREVVEYAETEKMFSKPADKRTEDYITGRFG